jgi:hypothetical protein
MEYIDYNTFASKLRSEDLTVQKLDVSYSMADTRCWTALINPETHNLIVTFVVNRHQIGNHYFDILSSKRILTDIYTNDIYEAIDALLDKQTTTTTYFNTADV